MSEACYCPCGCTAPAVTDDAGIPLCEVCQHYIVDPADDTVICGMVTEGFRVCHACGTRIAWGPIRSPDRTGLPQYIVGECQCGPVWIDEERGTWGHFVYDPGRALD